APVLFKWPDVGVIRKGINGENMAWQKVTAARRAYATATHGWAVIFVARFIVQNNLYNSSDTTTLGIVRILMGWPLTGLVTALPIWMVRRENSAMEAAIERGEVTVNPEELRSGSPRDEEAQESSREDAQMIETVETPDREDDR